MTVATDFPNIESTQIESAQKGLVLIRDLQFECIVGILPNERKQQQTLAVDVDMQLDFSQAVATEDVQYTVDYAMVSSQLIALAQKGQYWLVETFSSHALDLLFDQYPAILYARIHIKKPQAVKEAAYVGVELSRHRWVSTNE